MVQERDRNRGESKEKTHIYTDFYKIKLQENENQKGSQVKNIKWNDRKRGKSGNE